MSEQNLDNNVTANIIRFTYKLLDQKEERNLSYEDILKFVKSFIEDQTKNGNKEN